MATKKKPVTVEIKFSSEGEELLGEELRFVPPEVIFQRHVVLLAHLREMFRLMPKTYTMGKIKRFLPESPSTDREGPMVARLRQLSEEK